MQIKRQIKVSFQKEGVHKYPAALTDPKLATGEWDDVSFLGYPHRHIFHFYVTIEVTHNDRDIEFIQFKRWLERLYSTEFLELDYKSCEMIAEELIDTIMEKYPNRNIIVEVYEDNENGAVLSAEINRS
jgi:hypothetical protein